MIKIKISKIPYGWIIYPIRKDIKEKIKSHLAQFNIKSDGSVVFHNFSEIQFLEIFNKRDLKKISKGYSIVKKIDPWIFFHFYGWDTYILAENGEL